MPGAHKQTDRGDHDLISPLSLPIFDPNDPRHVYKFLQDPCHPMVFVARPGTPSLAGIFVPDPDDSLTLITEPWELGALFPFAGADTLTLSLVEALLLQKSLVVGDTLSLALNESRQLINVLPRAVFGLSLLYASYSGPLLKLRRSSDNALLDIARDGTGIDEAAMLAFVAGGDGFVHTWYDQTGHGLHLVQTNPTFQPQIINAGTVMTAVGFGGLPVMNFDGIDDYLANPSTIDQFISDRSGTVFVAFVPDSASITSLAGSYDGETLWADDAGFVGSSLFTNGGTPTLAAFDWVVGAEPARSANKAPITFGTGYLHIWYKQDASMFFNYLNTDNPPSIDLDGAGVTSIMTGSLRVGRNFENEYYDGKMRFLVFYDVGLEQSYLEQIATTYTTALNISWDS